MLEAIVAAPDGEAAAKPALPRPSDFDAFVVTRGPALWRSAWLLTGDSHRAEDLVQTALARTFRRFDSLDGPDAFESYLRTTMYRTYLAWWRRRWNGELPGDPERHPAAPGVDLDLRHDIRCALATLPRQQRAVLVLTFFEDLTGQQTAEVLGVSVGTVKSTLSRALAKLRTSPLLDDGSRP